MKHTTSGFTIVELLIAMSVIGILAILSVGTIPQSLAKGRDKERVADIDTLHSRLETYFDDHGGYPSTLNTTLFPRLDPLTLTDSKGNSMTINSPATDLSAALSSTTPTDGTPSEYTYTPYPTGCGGGTPCQGYVLKSYIEVPDSKISNPYLRKGINNN
jgi:prepilin-type N-terminal cleavage/methylation domain-containing protein